MPSDRKKTKQELIDELQWLRERNATLESLHSRDDLAERELLHAALECMDGMFVVMDPELRIVLSNWKDHEYVEESRRFRLPKCHQAIKGFDEPCQGCPVLKTFKDGKRRAYEDVNPADGSSKSIVTIPLYDESGAISHVAEYVRDVTMQKSAIEELKHIFEMSLDLICIADIEEVTFTKVNPAFTRVLGYSEEELLNRPFTEFIHPEDLEPTIKVVEEKLNSGAKVIDFENRYLCKNGEYRWLSWVSHPRPDRGITYAIARDVTAHKQAELELKKREERYALAFEGSNDGIWDWDRTTGEVYFSPRWKEIIGYEDHEIPNDIEEWRVRIHPDDYDRVMEKNDLFFHSDEDHFEVDYRIRHRDGDYRWVHGRGMCIRDENGVPVRMAGAHSDITERKRAEENLRASEKRLAQIIDFMPDATLVIDNNGRVIAWNQAIERLTGVRTEEMLGKGNFDYAVPFYGKRRPMLADLALRPRTYIHNAYESFQWNGDSITAEATITTPDGPQHIWGTATVLFDASGRAIGAIECIRDITELKNYQINLQRAKDNAEAANTAKSEFLANMSHEIRTPLNGVLGMLQLLQTTDLDKEQSNFVHTATFSGKSLLSVINDILDFSKIEAGKIELSNEPFSPANLVRTITETFALQASEKGIQLEHMVTKNVPDTVLGDNGRIRQVLFNLIGNAVKFTHEGRVGIVLDAETEDPENVRLLLTVADTGVGIDKQKLPNIFKPFTQADGSLARKYQGTGLGLSIVKRLVALMQGHIEIESEPGKGTRVKLDLLADAAATTRISETGRDAAASAGGNGAFRILVAEDNPVSQIFTIKILEKLGHQVTLVDNGNDVLAMLAGETFDLVLMDIQMPGMDGMEATRKIRKGDSGVLDSTVPIVAMTAHAMQGDREKFILTGMNDYVSKPLAVEELERIIRDTAARGKENPGG